MDDPFGALDDSAFDDGHVRSRDDRMRAAFEESRRSYNPFTELIIVSEGWYSPPAALPGIMAAKAALKTIDYEISRLYAQRDYARVLEIVQSELRKPETVDSKEYHRSLLDTGMRCCTKLGDFDIGLPLLDSGKDKWIGSPSLALTSSELLLAAGRAREAISTVLTALEGNASLNPCLNLLLRALMDLGSNSEAARHLAEHLRAKMGKQRQRDFPFLTQRRQALDANSGTITVENDTVIRWCQSCGLDNDSAIRLQTLLLFAKPVEDEMVPDGPTRRSVREL